MSTSAIPSFIKVSSGGTARVSGTSGGMITKEITQGVNNLAAAAVNTRANLAGLTTYNTATSTTGTPLTGPVTTSLGMSGPKFVSNQQGTVAYTTSNTREGNYQTVDYSRKISTSDTRGPSTITKVMTAEQYIQNEPIVTNQQTSRPAFVTSVGGGSGMIGGFVEKTGNLTTTVTRASGIPSTAQYTTETYTTGGAGGHVMSADQYIKHDGASSIGNASRTQVTEQTRIIEGSQATGPTHITQVVDQERVSVAPPQTSGQWSVASETHKEFGEQRLISRTERVDESRSHIISERTEEREILIPKRIVREEIIERTIVIPEKVIREEVVNAAHVYREKIIERSKPTIVEKVIEVPEIEIVERIVEEPEIVYYDVNIQKEVGEPEVIEEAVYVDRPRIVEKEVVVEVPREVTYDEIRTKYVDRPVEVEKPVITHVPRRIPVYKTREVKMPRRIARKLPIPVAVEAEYEYRVPQLRPVYTKQTFEMYIPRFIEVPVPREMLSEELVALTEQQLKQVMTFTSGNPTLCEIETVAAEIGHSNVQKELSVATAQDAVKRAWESGNLELIKAQ